MSAESVRAWLAENAPELRYIEADDTTATVETAARTLGVEPGQIAKTLAVRAGEHLFLLVARGDARLDNRKCKDELGARPRMLGADETFELTGHPVGGVCPFGLKNPLPIYFDRSLRFSIEHGHDNNLTLDLSSVAYWYQSEPHKPFPAFPSREARKPKPKINEVDIHLWRDAWRKANGSGSQLWGNEKKEKKD